MKSAVPKERNCSVGRTINVMGDGWSFMVLRECFFGTTRFDGFLTMLGLPRSTLSSRLRRLTELGVIEARAYSSHPPRKEYKLTAAGKDLYPVVLALMAFGDRWLAGRRGKTKPLQLVHRECGRPCSAIVVCPHCHLEIRAHEVSYRDGPGAGRSRITADRKSRRSTDPTALERKRPSSVARTLQVIGDRWSFMILREAFFKVRRFDEWQDALGIAPNILADRLARLVDEGVFKRVRYQRNPERFEYRFTAMGRDLYAPLIAMLRWGDDWFSRGKPPLLLQHKRCGQDFRPEVVCNKCLQALTSAAMRFRMNYKDPHLDLA